MKPILLSLVVLVLCGCEKSYEITSHKSNYEEMKSLPINGVVFDFKPDNPVIVESLEDIVLDCSEKNVHCINED